MLDIFHKLPPQAKKFLETHGESLWNVLHHFVLSHHTQHNVSHSTLPLQGSGQASWCLQSAWKSRFPSFPVPLYPPSCGLHTAYH